MVCWSAWQWQFLWLVAVGLLVVWKKEGDWQMSELQYRPMWISVQDYSDLYRKFSINHLYLPIYLWWEETCWFHLHIFAYLCKHFLLAFFATITKLLLRQKTKQTNKQTNKHTHRIIRELFTNTREKSFIQTNIISETLCFWQAWPAWITYIYLEESSHCISQEMTMERNKECSSFSFPLIYTYSLLAFFYDNLWYHLFWEFSEAPQPWLPKY